MSKMGSEAGSGAGGMFLRGENGASFGRLTKEKSFKVKPVRGIELAPRKARKKGA
jgi:hypothetical protein